MKYLNFLLFLLTPIFMLFCGGCGDKAYVPSGPTAASSWQSTSKALEAKDDRMTVTILGETKCPDSAQRIINKKFETMMTKGTIKQKALDFADIGVNALHFGDCDIAKKSLDNAIAIMDSIISDEKILEEVLSLPGSEKDKIFKGEPHERAMCYFYRGLIYLSEGDYENSRACFVNGEMQSDRYTDNKAVRGNWVSLRYLQAFSNKYDTGSQEMAFPVEIPNDLAIGTYHDGDDSLIVVVTGYAPAKVHYSLEKDKHGLGYRDVESTVSTIRLYELHEPNSSPSRNDTLDNDYLNILDLPRPSEDIYVQAVSHGRRKMDEVLKEKESEADKSTKNAETWEAIGSGAAQAGVWGLPVVGISMVLGGAERDKAASADSVGDLRQLSSLPRNLYLASFKSSSSKFIIEAINKNGTTIRSNAFSMPRADYGKVNIVLARIYN